MKKHFARAAPLLLLLMLTLAAPVGAAGVTITGDAVYGGTLHMQGMTVETGWRCTWEYGSGSTWEPIIYANQKADLKLTHEMCGTYDMVGQMIRVTMEEVSTKKTYQATAGPVAKGPQEPPQNLRATAPSTGGGSDGTIYNLNPDLYYAYSANGGASWQTVAAGAKKIEGLTSGSYLVRNEENQWGLRSEPTSILVPGNDEEIVEEWLQSEAFVTALLGDNTDAEHITTALGWRAKVGNDVCVKYSDTAITWSAEPSGYIDVSNGIVNRPSDGIPKPVVLTATIVLNAETTLTREIHLTIQPAYKLGGTIRFIRTSPDGHVYRDGWENVEVGDTLTADLSQVTPEGVDAADVAMQWLYLNNGTPRSITGARSIAYTVSEKQLNRQIGFKIAGDGVHYVSESSVKAYIPGKVVAAGEAPEPAQKFETQIALKVPAAAAKAGKLSYHLYRLDEAGALAGEAGEGTLDGTSLPLSLDPGDYRLELRGEGYLPYVIRLQGVAEGSTPPAQLAAAALIPGKLYTEGGKEYAITAADYQKMIEVYDAPAGLSAAHRAADFNSSGDVDFFDLAALIENIGKVGNGQPEGADYTPCDLAIDCR